MKREDYIVTMSMVPNMDYCKGYNAAVDFIFKEIESQICKNCEYLGCENCPVSSKDNHHWHEFGCNQWEPKND